MDEFASHDHHRGYESDEVAPPLELLNPRALNSSGNPAGPSAAKHLAPPGFASHLVNESSSAYQGHTAANSEAASQIAPQRATDTSEVTTSATPGENLGAGSGAE